MEYDQEGEFSVKPGLHEFSGRGYSVVWWDPSCLQLGVEPNFGLRLEEVLADDAGSGVAERGLRRYEEWKARRAQAAEQGRRAEFDVLTAVEAAEPPPAFQGAIAVEELPRPPGRPSGRRFGTLVHTVLRDADLAGEPRNIEALARLHARVLGATEEETGAATEAVAAALRHPLLRRASAAERCFRELPVIHRLDNGMLLDGVIDLAFFHDGAWTVVDFKSDADLPARRARYERQLQWYVFALSRITGAPASGWLLSV
jgi:ATP-dependent exoDNAse (exonuclease V) beta subunit